MRQERARVRMRKARKYATLGLLIAALGGGLYLLGRGAEKVEKVKPGEFFSEMGKEHVSETPPLEEYNSLPPTSGPHYAQQTNWGIHKEPIAEGYQVHNLEHGGILMQYKPGLDPNIIKRLEGVGEDYNWKKIILAPNPSLDKWIALTAWERLDTFDDFEETRIRAFIDSYRNRGPENVPDNMQSVTLP